MFRCGNIVLLTTRFHSVTATDKVQTGNKVSLHRVLPTEIKPTNLTIKDADDTKILYTCQTQATNLAASGSGCSVSGFFLN